MSERKYSPVPWKREPSKLSSGITRILDQGGQTICALPERGVSDANADFILLACNSYPTLVAELDATITAMMSICNMSDDGAVLVMARQVADRLATTTDKAEGRD